MVKSSDVLLIVVAILFPPAAAAFITGCSCDLLINILLTVLGYLPGHIHACEFLIYKKIKAEEEFGYGGFRYVGSGRYVAASGQAQNQAPPSYGAV
ncbi:hypothetical protein BCV69DRAFT_245017 [Microstroma glucosiphilum]|uniref:Uncharacterized protein n=1 Tax=Pseudomicrostroma glucosiphilum TaxID=1684307 RepID=A0A316UE14_9BASI|nr:hypothetical protein BCV69DRAFT_245017 [Pseudomicrostroma glucosiphilum]PWN23104.1 hypothetical protein BCV69DRAFT_245017 [Pseudomicrostroma glucosiphilum]